MTETIRAKETVLPWTSSEMCFKSPLGSSINERSEASWEVALISKAWTSFWDHTTVFFQVIIDRAFLCRVNNQPTLSRGWSNSNEVRFPRLQTRGNVRLELPSVELFGSRAICSIKERAAVLWRLTYITSYFKEKYISPPTEFSYFRSSLIFFKLIFSRPEEYIQHSGCLSHVSPGTLWTSYFEWQGHRDEKPCPQRAQGATSTCIQEQGRF